MVRTEGNQGCRENAEAEVWGGRAGHRSALRTPGSHVTDRTGGGAKLEREPKDTNDYIC